MHMELSKEVTRSCHTHSVRHPTVWVDSKFHLRISSKKDFGFSLGGQLMITVVPIKNTPSDTSISSKPHFQLSLISSAIKHKLQQQLASSAASILVIASCVTITYP